MMAHREKTKFRVVLKEFRCVDLPAKDRNGLSDPYVSGNFDNYKTFKTEVRRRTLSPEWKFSLSFMYETKFANKLDKKALKLTVFDWDRVGGDDLCGAVKIDLLTLATGPREHDVLLRDGNRAAGRLRFYCEMEEYSELDVTLKSARIEQYTATTSDPLYLQYFVTRDDAVDDEAPAARSKLYRTRVVDAAAAAAARQTLAWEDGEQMFVAATLRELMASCLVVRLHAHARLRRDAALGETRMPLRALVHPRRDGTLMAFAEPLRESLDEDTAASADGAVIGRLEGMLRLRRIPQRAQMTGGVHTELGVEGGAPLLPDMPHQPRELVHIVEVGALREARQQQQQQAAAAAAADNEEPAEFGLLPAAPGAPRYSPRDDTAAPVALAAPPPQLLSPRSPPRSPAPSPRALAAAIAADTAAHGGATRGDDALPPGWSKRHDSQGRAYYACRYTASTQWTPPSAAQTADALRRAALEQQERRAEAVPAHATSPRDLPPGWECRVDEQTQRPFYVCHLTRQTQWHAPTAEQREAALKHVEEEKRLYAALKG